MSKNKTKERFTSNISIQNKKARYEFEFLETAEAGIVLQGSEIKSIREGKVSLQEAYCYVSKGQAFVKGMNIAEYTESTYDNHAPTRERKLLLKKREIEKFQTKIDQKALTIVVTKLYINARGFAKVEIALAKGKKIHDKRDSIKQKDQARELERTQY
jgi:SsrA-binding protein